MATLIAVYTSDGCVGRCDAKCYNATGDKCNCICHGRNHGVGAKKAIQQTEQYAHEWLDRWKQEHPQHDIILETVNLEEPPPKQLKLL